MKKSSSPREAAFRARLKHQEKEIFLSITLREWKEKNHPDPRDYTLAQEIAYGSLRRKLTLNAIAKKLSSSGKLPAKQKERIILQMALYQYYFMDKVPLYALTDEHVSLAKKECHHSFARFLNALLRKLPETLPIPSPNKTVDSLATYYSFPSFFIEQLLKDYSSERAKEIMEQSNLPPQLMLRIRGNNSSQKNLIPLVEKPFPIATLADSSQLPQFAQSSDYYIQNVTPSTLIAELATFLPSPPQNILDLCASPGGKSLAIHDLYPNAKLTLNDISEEKTTKIKENLKKYNLTAKVTQQAGETFPKKEKFDLIILDAPCSNSGVLGKRAEARWRLSQETLEAQVTLQKELIEHALSLLNPKGQLWYLTCSILKAENEKLIEVIQQQHNLKVLYQKTILPNEKGWDGGFAAALTN